MRFKSVLLTNWPNIMSYTVILEPEQYSPSALALYAKLGSVSSERLPGERQAEELADARVIVIRLGRVTKELLDKVPNLQVIASPTTGLNHIDLEDVERRGIKIVSLKGRRDITEKVYTTSEHTVALLLSLIRRIPGFNQHVLQGGWDQLAARRKLAQLPASTLRLLAAYKDAHEDPDHTPPQPRELIHAHHRLHHQNQC